MIQEYEYRGIIVTYNPDDSIKAHIKKLIENNSKLIIVDNGSSGLSSIEDLSVVKNKNVTFLKLKKNYGLAFAQNYAIEHAINDSVDYIFLLDQDSELPADYFEKMILFYHQWMNKYKIGIVAPNFYDSGIGMQTNYAVLTPLSFRNVSCSDQNMKEVSFVVASGTMIPASVLKNTGLMRSDFFIDHIDSEYSLRLRKSGYKILVNCGMTMNHTIGERTIHKLAGLTIKPNHHGPLRKYYIFRNGLRIIWIYGWRYPGFTVLMFQRMVHDILGILFFEKNKTVKIAAVFQGMIASFLPFKKIGPENIG